MNASTHDRTEGRDRFAQRLVRGTAAFHQLQRRARARRDVLRDTMQDGARASRRAIRDARHRAEDAALEAALVVRRRPLRSLGLAALGGAVVGAMLTLVARVRDR